MPTAESPWARRSEEIDGAASVVWQNCAGVERTHRGASPRPDQRPVLSVSQPVKPRRVGDHGAVVELDRRRLVALSQPDPVTVWELPLDESADWRQLCPEGVSPRSSGQRNVVWTPEGLALLGGYGVSSLTRVLDPDTSACP